LFAAGGRLNCDRPAKHPLPKFAPNGFKDASTDGKVVAHWWNCVPHANVGVATGSIVALDIDPRHGGDESLQRLEAKYGQLPITWRACTGGGGEHILFLPPSNIEIRTSVGLLAPGIDIRGADGYIVGVGSKHISGRNYVWNCDYHPDDVELAEMPAWIVNAIKAPNTASARSSQLAYTLTGEVSEGRRDQTGTRLAGYLLRRYVDPIIVHELLQAWNEIRCVPPMPPRQVTKIVNSIAGKELRRREAANGSQR
jgi:Bifunctional DNA primase/polymerase, N-terminal/Primase C terminal 1 (PriCT-1)